MKSRAAAVGAAVIVVALVTGCGSAASPSGGALNPASTPAGSVSQPSGAGTTGAAPPPTRANVPVVARNCQGNGGDASDPNGSDGSNGSNSDTCAGNGQGSAGDDQAGDRGGDNQAGDSKGDGP